MASPNFPSTGLVSNVTTFAVGNLIYLWDGEKWKTITAQLNANQIKWTDSKTVGSNLNDLQGFTDALLEEAGLADTGIDDTVSYSRRLEAIKLICSKETTVESFAELEALSPTEDGLTPKRFICIERANAEYLLQPSGYVALAGDVTFANGRVGELQISGVLKSSYFGLTGFGDETDVVKLIADRYSPLDVVIFDTGFTITETIEFNKSGFFRFGGHKIDGSGIPSSTVDRTLNQALKFSGYEVESTSISADLNVGDNSFISVGHGLAAGDTCIIRSDQFFVDEWDGGVNNKRGEIVTVKSVSGDTVTFHEALRFSYDSASGLVAVKISTITPIISGINLSMGGVGSEHRGVLVEYARDAIIEQSECDGAEDVSFSLSYCHTAKINATAKNSTTPTSGFNTGYGVSVVNGSRNIDVNVTGYNCKHVVTGGGALPAVEVRVSGVAYDCGLSSTAWDCHEPCFDWIWDVECVGGNAGIGIRGSEQRGRIVCRNQASNSIRVKTFNDVGTQRDVDFNVISYNAGSSALLFDSEKQPIENVNIDAKIHNSLINAVSVLGNLSYGIRNVTGNIFVDGADSRALDARYVDDLAVIIDASGTLEGGVQILNSSNINIATNVTTDYGRAISMEDCNDVAISGTMAESNAAIAIYTARCSNVNVTTKNLKSTGITNDCWRAVDTVGGMIHGVKMVSGRHGVYSTGTSNYFIVTNVNAVDVTNNTKFNLSGAGNISANNLQ